MSTAVQSDPLEAYYFQHEEQRICGLDVHPITDENVENYPTVVDRFFTRYYYIKGKEGPNPVPYQVLFHSNRVCLICLAPEHPALRSGITNLNFDIGNTDRSKNAVKGKGKKGGMVLQADSTLALLTDVDGKVYKVPSCVRSKLVEVNVELVSNPKLLENVAEGEAYMAIVLPKPEHCDEIKSTLLTFDEYQEYLRNSNFNEKENVKAESDADEIN